MDMSNRGGAINKKVEIKKKSLVKYAMPKATVSFCFSILQIHLDNLRCRAIFILSWHEYTDTVNKSLLNA